MASRVSAFEAIGLHAPEPAAAAPSMDGTRCTAVATFNAVEALGQLSENQRRVLGLAIDHGLTHEQIAQHTGLPLGTVKTHARRGLLRVRELLGSPQSDAAMESKA